MKACPFCAEQIQDAAVVCRYCNRDQPATAMAAVAPTSPSGLRRFFDWLRFGWIRPEIQCRQCRTTGQVRTMKGAASHGFCSRCRTRWKF